MVFSPDLRENGGVVSMRMQAILDSLFARPGSAPIWGGKKGEFRDLTRIRACDGPHSLWSRSIFTGKSAEIFLPFVTHWQPTQIGGTIFVTGL